MFKSLLKFKKNIALFDKENKILYKDFFEKKEILKNEFNTKKLVLIICENKLAILFYYIVIHLLKASIILLDCKTRDKEIKDIIKKYKPDFIVTNLQRKNKLKINFIPCDNFKNYFLFKDPQNKKISLNKKVSILIPTSGSIGTPKFVMLSYENLKDNTNKISKYLKINEKDKAITNMSLAYSYMISVINSHIWSGASIFVTDKSILSREFWSDFKKNKISSFNGVPYAYKLIEKLNIKIFSNKNIKYLTQAGGELEEEIKKKFIKKCLKSNIRFYCMYGQTEASPRISFLNPKYALKKIGSVGKPLSNYEIKLFNYKNKIITKPNLIGKLILYGKNIFLGYANSRKDLSKIIKLKYKLNTEDFGYRDKDGFLYLTARSSKIAKIFGFRIDILELEYKMKKLGYTVYCSEKNNHLKISYENNYNKNLLIKKLSDLTNLDQSGFIAIYMNKLPLNKNHKIDRNRL